MIALCAWLGVATAADLPVPAPVRFPPRGEPTLSLEGVLHTPARAGQEPVPGLVVCHPDPRMGGAMDDRVVTALTSAAAEGGYAVLRFNFRGVGHSEGSFGDGKGEVKDTLGAWDYLSRQPGIDPRRVALAGYSFGSTTALLAFAQEPRASAYAGVAVPYSGLPHEREGLKGVGPLARSAFVVIGTEDEYGDADAIAKLFEEKQIQAEVRTIAGADHFFHEPPGALSEAARAVVEFLDAHRAPQSERG